MCEKYSIKHILNLISQSKLKQVIQENNHIINKHQVCETSTN